MPHNNYELKLVNWTQFRKQLEVSPILSGRNKLLQQVGKE